MTMRARTIQQRHMLGATRIMPVRGIDIGEPVDAPIPIDRLLLPVNPLDTPIVPSPVTTSTPYVNPALSVLSTPPLDTGSPAHFTTFDPGRFGRTIRPTRQIITVEPSSVLDVPLGPAVPVGSPDPLTTAITGSPASTTPTGLVRQTPDPLASAITGVPTAPATTSAPAIAPVAAANTFNILGVAIPKVVVYIGAGWALLKLLEGNSKRK